MKIRTTVKVSFIIVSILVVIITGANWIILDQLKQNNMAQRNVVELISAQEEMGVLIEYILKLNESSKISKIISEFSKQKREFEDVQKDTISLMNQSIIGFSVADMQNSKEVHQGIAELLKNEKRIETIFFTLLKLQEQYLSLLREHKVFLNKEKQLLNQLKREIANDSSDEIIIAEYVLLEHNRNIVLFEKPNKENIKHWLYSIERFEKKINDITLQDYYGYAQKLSEYALKSKKIRDEQSVYKQQLDEILERNKTVGFIIEEIVENSLAKSIDKAYSLIIALLISTISLVAYLAYRIYKHVGFSVDAIEEKISNGLSEIKELNKEIEDTQREIVLTMGAIAEERSRETGQHVKRVAEYCYILGKYSGLSEHECELLKKASPMHDIGKLAIPDAILTKDGRLTESERKIMNEHAYFGYTMLQHSERELLKTAALIAYEHHEKWDGTGYPNGLKGEEIHIFGRITAFADVFDALGSERSYKKAWDDTKVFDFFKEQRGKHLDPKLVDIFFEHLDEFLVIREQLRDKFD